MGQKNRNLKESEKFLKKYGNWLKNKDKNTSHVCYPGGNRARASEIMAKLPELAGQKLQSGAYFARIDIEQTTQNRQIAKMRRFFLTKILLSACAMLALAPPAWPQNPVAFPEFQAKRIKPPKSGSGQRITIQVSPEDMARQRGTPKVLADTAQSPVTALASKDPVAARAASYAWFWEGVSVDMADSGPGRLRPALEKLSNPPAGVAIYAPRLQKMQDIARAQGIEILKSTIGTNVSPALVLAVITVESSGEPQAVSGAGAQGLMQLMPATAERFGVTDALNAGDNIRGGVAFLDFLMKKFDHDPILVLAGYNAGETAVKSHAGVPPFVETRDYVPKVLAAYLVARGLCKTPPELITDGCVFNTM